MEYAKALSRLFVLANERWPAHTRGPAQVAGLPRLYFAAKFFWCLFGHLFILRNNVFQWNNFTGRFFIEGSLATVPTEDDWFAINIGNNVVNYMEATAHTGVEAKTFQG